MLGPDGCWVRRGRGPGNQGSTESNCSQTQQETAMQQDTTWHEANCHVSRSVTMSRSPRSVLSVSPGVESSEIRNAWLWLFFVCLKVIFFLFGKCKRFRDYMTNEYWARQPGAIKERNWKFIIHLLWFFRGSESASANRPACGECMGLMWVHE